MIFTPVVRFLLASHGTPDPTAPQAVLGMLRTLEEQQAPPKRRYGPDAPQRQSRKGTGES